MKIEQTTIETFSQRRKIREEIERSQVEGIRVDAANVCVCPVCAGVHYKRKTENQEEQSK